MHTRARLVWPDTVTMPICRLGMNLRFTRFLAWLTWCPYCGSLPQIAQRLAMRHLPIGVLKKADDAQKANPRT